MFMFDLRAARPSDSDDLFAWRNDSVTCAGSRSTAAVSREDHELWMKFNVQMGYPEHIVLIAESDFSRVGVVRFDSVKGDLLSYRASITMAPLHRGKGLARPILAEACAYMHEFTINAEVRSSNAPSRRIFERCGFKEVGGDHGFVNYRRGPLS